MYFNSKQLTPEKVLQDNWTLGNQNVIINFQSSQTKTQTTPKNKLAAIQMRTVPYMHTAMPLSCLTTCSGSDMSITK